MLGVNNVPVNGPNCHHSDKYIGLRKIRTSFSKVRVLRSRSTFNNSLLNANSDNKFE